MEMCLAEAQPHVHVPCRSMRALSPHERVPAIPTMLEQMFYLMGERDLITLSPITDLEADDELELLFELAA